MNRWTVALTAILVSCGLPPAHAATAPDSAPRSAALQLNALVEQYFEDALRESPLVATFIGDERYNDRLENTASPQYVALRKATESRYLQQIKQLDVASLDLKSRVTYEIFVYERELALEGMSFPGHLLALTQMDSITSAFAVLGSGTNAQPFQTVKDYDNFLARSRDFVVWVDQAIVSLREGAASGVTVPQVAMAKVVPQLRDVAVGKPEDSIFWKPIEAMPKEISATDRARLTNAYREAIGRQILPAYSRLADYIEKEYLPRARKTVAWTALPQGQAWYAYSVKAQTTSNYTPARIHELGLQEVARIRGEMEAVKRQVKFNGDLHAFFRHLQDDPGFYYTRGQDLVDGYIVLKKRIDGLLPQMFADFPKSDYIVREVEPFRAESAPGAFYQPPSADGKRPGIFYINTFNLRAQPKFAMETLSLHEAAPGHHFQVAIQQELTELPRFRRFNSYNAYQEGWALYCESIGRELGLFTDPYQWYGRLSDEMLRAMRLVVDTGLHSKGWTREQAVAYMIDNSSLAPTDVAAEVDRYIVTPGQALGYKIGQLRIGELRARAEKALGASFDIKEFHSQVLRDGGLPLSVLEAKIDRWIASGGQPAKK